MQSGCHLSLMSQATPVLTRRDLLLVAFLKHSSEIFEKHLKGHQAWLKYTFTSKKNQFKQHETCSAIFFSAQYCKRYDEYPCHFYIGVPPHPPGSQPTFSFSQFRYSIRKKNTSLPLCLFGSI